MKHITLGFTQEEVDIIEKALELSALILSDAGNDFSDNVKSALYIFRN